MPEIVTRARAEIMGPLTDGRRGEPAFEGALRRATPAELKLAWAVHKDRPRHRGQRRAIALRADRLRRRPLARKASRRRRA